MAESKEDCIFCNIAKKAIKADVVFENDQLMVVNDILPEAPVHFLVIPKAHISSVNALSPEDRMLVGDMVMAAQAQAVKQGVTDSGYRLVINVGKDSGGTIDHLHLHLLGGKYLGDRILG